ncbi:MAG TPA: hypothetical protein VM434_17525 [Beijerinckiaceae bacterium]|nr:hypothetical protein [Beijerinckiaceae bacterium]
MNAQVRLPRFAPVVSPLDDLAERNRMLEPYRAREAEIHSLATTLAESYRLLREAMQYRTEYHHAPVPETVALADVFVETAEKRLAELRGAAARRPA